VQRDHDMPLLHRLLAEQAARAERDYAEVDCTQQTYRSL
jgi:hypothetical protein